MNHFEINKEKLIKDITRHFLETEGFDIYSDESAEELNQIECYVHDAPFLDSDFKLDFENRLTVAVEGAALDAFENGLNLGLSLLCELLSGQQPEIVVHCKPPRKLKPVQYQAETFKSNPDFLDHMKKADTHMNDIEKQFIASMATVLMQGHFEDIRHIRQELEKSLSEPEAGEERRKFRKFLNSRVI